MSVRDSTLLSTQRLSWAREVGVSGCLETSFLRKRRHLKSRRRLSQLRRYLSLPTSPTSLKLVPIFQNPLALSTKNQSKKRSLIKSVRNKKRKIWKIINWKWLKTSWIPLVKKAKIFEKRVVRLLQRNILTALRSNLKFWSGTGLGSTHICWSTGLTWKLIRIIRWPSQMCMGLKLCRRVRWIGGHTRSR